jgi:uncharacterized protein (TIGR03435 family)
MFTRIALFAAIATGLFAQDPAFEVASVKPAAAPDPMQMAAGKIRIGMKIDAGRVDIGFMSLADLIRTAYEVKLYQVSGPDWINTTRFDVLAKIPDGVDKSQVPAMLRALLAERFGLKVHKENREHSVYALIVGKGGSKLKEAEPDTEPTPDGVSVKPGLNGNGATVMMPGMGAMKMSMHDGAMHMEASRASMATFTEMLSRFTDKPVVDDTGLKGNYKIELELSMADMMRIARNNGIMPMRGGSGRGSAAPPDTASDPSGNSIFAAVQALGLKLEPRKEAVEAIIVDHAEKTPVEN